MDTIVKQFVKTGEQNDVIITNHTSKIEVLEDDKAKCEASIQNILGEGDNHLWTNEKRVVEGLKKEVSKIVKEIDSLETDRSMRQAFRPIDISFLTRKQAIKIPQEVSAPFFSVHKVHSSSVDGIEVELKYDPKREIKLTATFRRDGYKLSDVFAQHMTKAFSVDGQPLTWERLRAGTYQGQIGSRKLRWFKTSDESFRKKFVSKFVGLIPAEIKEKIAKAREITKEVYLIKEAQWNVEEIVVDPLIVCVSPSGEAYLVGSFNCTPVEYWTKKEF